MPCQFKVFSWSLLFRKVNPKPYKGRNDHFREIARGMARPKRHAKARAQAKTQGAAAASAGRKALGGFYKTF